MCFILELFFSRLVERNGTETSRRMYFKIFPKMKPTVFLFKHIALFRSKGDCITY